MYHQLTYMKSLYHASSPDRTVEGPKKGTETNTAGPQRRVLEHRSEGRPTWRQSPHRARRSTSEESQKVVVRNDHVTLARMRGL
jgi:hypothetical protein